jgi:hypothetical protein
MGAALTVLEVAGMLVVVVWVMAGLAVMVDVGCDNRWPRSVKEWVVVAPWIWMLLASWAFSWATGWPGVGHGGDE